MKNGGINVMCTPSDFGVEVLETDNSEGMARAELLTHKRKIESKEKQRKKLRN